MRFGDIKRRVYDRLGDDFDSPTRYTAFMIYDLLREACEQWIARHGGNVHSVTISLVANQLEYTLPTDCVEVLEVMYDTLSIPLTPYGWQDMYESTKLNGIPWRDINGVRPTQYVVFGLNQLWVWPTLATVTTQTVTVSYVSSELEDLESALSSDHEDLALIPREHHDVLVDYVVGRCLMIGSKDEPHLQDALDLLKRWAELVDNDDSKMQRGNTFAPTQNVILNR